MKHSIILAAMMLIGITACQAQKANVRKARNLALAETPDFAAARTSIDAAFKDPATANQTETWYVAGLIGYQQNKAEVLKQQLGKGGNDYVQRGKWVLESYRYWIAADSLSQVPVVNSKGKAKYDTKTRRLIADKMIDYYIQMELVNYAVETYNKKDYITSYEAFRAYLTMPDLPMFQEKRYTERMVKSEDFSTYTYYMGLAVYYQDRFAEAANIFQNLLDDEKNGILSGEYLYQCYINLNDSAQANAVLDDCIRRFPAEPWFIQNRINNLVKNGDMNAAVEYLDRAIQNEPQVQYFISKGSILNMQKRFEEAIATYEAALSIDPQNASVYENYGFVYTDMANQLNDQAADLNATEYKKARVQIDETFRKALPYFEKALELDSENYDYRRTLRSLYYRLGDMDNYNKLAD